MRRPQRQADGGPARRPGQASTRPRGVVQTMMATQGDQRLLIGGSWEPAASGAVLDVHDPATGEVIAEVPDAGAADVDRAVAAAEKAFESNAWRGLTPAARAQLLWKVADVIDAHAD